MRLIHTVLSLYIFALWHVDCHCALWNCQVVPTCCSCVRSLLDVLPLQAPSRRCAMLYDWLFATVLVIGLAFCKITVWLMPANSNGISYSWIVSWLAEEFFFYQTVRDWNCLPDDIVLVSLPEQFSDHRCR